jgi:hypothetical protein
VDQTILTDEGVITHVISTTICPPPGIAVLGAPLVSGGMLLGIRPFDDNCNGGPGAFFLSAPRILASEGVSLI